MSEYDHIRKYQNKRIFNSIHLLSHFIFLYLTQWPSDKLKWHWNVRILFKDFDKHRHISVLYGSVCVCVWLMALNHTHMNHHHLWSVMFSHWPSKTMKLFITSHVFFTKYVSGHTHVTVFCLCVLTVHCGFWWSRCSVADRMLPVHLCHPWTLSFCPDHQPQRTTRSGVECSPTQTHAYTDTHTRQLHTSEFIYSM